MSFKKVTKIIVVFSFVLLFGTSVAAAADKPVLTVGNLSLDEREVLNLLATTTQGNQMMMGLMLAQSTLPERIELVDQMSQILLFAEAAKMNGLDSRPDVAFQIKLETMKILMHAHFEQFATKIDMSESAFKKYYDKHENEFYEAPAARTRHILTQTEGEALNAALEIYRTKDFAKVASENSRDPNSANNAGELGWVEKGMMVPEVEAAIEGASIGSLVGPVKSDYGWHIIEVTERRSGKQLSFDESKDNAAERLQRQYLEEEIKRLGAKFGVNIDEEALENLGGIPAPAVVQE